MVGKKSWIERAALKPIIPGIKKTFLDAFLAVAEQWDHGFHIVEVRFEAFTANVRMRNERVYCTGY